MSRAVALRKGIRAIADSSPDHKALSQHLDEPTTEETSEPGLGGPAGGVTGKDLLTGIGALSVIKNGKEFLAATWRGMQNPARLRDLRNVGSLWTRLTGPTSFIAETGGLIGETIGGVRSGIRAGISATQGLLESGLGTAGTALQSSWGATTLTGLAGATGVGLVLGGLVYGGAYYMGQRELNAATERAALQTAAVDQMLHDARTARRAWDTGQGIDQLTPAQQQFLQRRIANYGPARVPATTSPTPAAVAPRTEGANNEVSGEVFE